MLYLVCLIFTKAEVLKTTSWTTSKFTSWTPEHMGELLDGVMLASSLYAKLTVTWLYFHIFSIDMSGINVL